jgi:hypothetical protein
MIDQHLRPDRNEFITVPTAASEAPNFIQFKSINYSLGSYDFASIMNHPFTNYYKPIAGKLPQDVSSISVGNSTKISLGDKIYLKGIYTPTFITSGTNSITNGTPNSTSPSNDSCSNEQLITWGLGCYYHIPAYNPAKLASTVLPVFYNQNTAYETNSNSSAQVKCVNGGWQLQSAKCSNLPGITTGTSNQGCAQTTLRWPPASTNSLCYLANPQSLPQSAPVGSIFEVSTQQKNYPVGFGIFVCETNAASGVVSWNYKPSLTYKNTIEKYSQTRNSFCYSRQDTTDQCPIGTGFNWRSTSGNYCSGTLATPLTLGSKTAVIAPAGGNWGWARVTCSKQISANSPNGFSYTLFVDTSENSDPGYCGHLTDGNPAPIDLSSSGQILKLVKCLPSQKLITWRDNFYGEECSSSVTINNEYFEGEQYIYQNTLEGNSFNSIVTLKCTKDPSTGAGFWTPASPAEINAANGLLPSPVCKKSCLPPTQLSWTNSTNNYTCLGTPPQNRKLIEDETIQLKAINLGATADSQAEFACSASGMINKTQNTTNKCAH